MSKQTSTLRAPLKTRLVFRGALDIVGETETGRVLYHLGLDGARAAFTEAAESADAEVLILTEQAFLAEEKRFAMKRIKRRSAVLQRLSLVLMTHCLR